MRPGGHDVRPAGGRSLRFALGLGVVALALVYGVLELFDLRFSSGDLYPYASSSRADPLGSKALHDALAELPGVRVERNLRPLDRLEVGGPTTVLLLGAEPGMLDDDDAELLFTAESLATRGARVVIAFRPIVRAPLGAGGRDDVQAAEKRSENAPAGAKKAAPVPLWGFTARWSARESESPAPVAQAERAAGAAAELPESVPVRSVLAFANPAATWTTVYRAGADAVWLERRVGAGSLVVAADGYPFSNEALLLERQPELLTWAIGNAARSRVVVFDESHLGVEEEGGVMVLARRYRLQAVVGVLLVLALLFVWRAAANLIEPPPAVERHLVEGGDAAAGLARLLGRGIAAREVLGVAAERWARDCGRGHEAAAKAARGAAAASADPVVGYAAVRAAIAEHAPRLILPAVAGAGSASTPVSTRAASRKEDHAG